MNLNIGSSVSDLAKIYTSTYVVQPGDSLMKISMKFKVNSKELANINNIFGETIFPNQVSRISLNIRQPVWFLKWAKMLGTENTTATTPGSKPKTG